MGTITGLQGARAHTLDNIEMGRAVLLVYRVTQEAKYAKAAKFLHDQLAVQPRTASGGYWHKQIYPNQMWLDGAYMAEPFRAMYAATFRVPEEFGRYCEAVAADGCAHAGSADRAAAAWVG